MSVFLVSTYVVKPDKLEEYKAMYRRWLKYKKENPEEVKELELNRGEYSLRPLVTSMASTSKSMSSTAWQTMKGT